MNARNCKMSSKSGCVFFLNIGHAAFITVLLLFMFAYVPVTAHTAAYEPIPAGYSSRTIQVKFQEGTDVSIPEQLLPAELGASVANTMRLFSGLSPNQLDEIKVIGELNRERPSPT